MRLWPVGLVRFTDLVIRKTVCRLHSADSAHAAGSGFKQQVICN
jgi:hypothetical protein